MKYDFDRMTDRRDTGSYKWDISADELPMWVADMDFQTAPEIIRSVEQRASAGIYGYTVVPDDWSAAYIDWWREHHGAEFEKDWLIFSSGVILAISSIVRRLTRPAEKVLLQTPVYNIFFNSVINNGRQVIESQLAYDGTSYYIDFEDLETKLSDPQTTMMILCSPHNPTGNIWDRETLERIGELCGKYGVVVVSDEAHCDLTDPGYEYIPYASVSESCRQNSVTCISPSKTFNLAGLQSAAVVVPNEILRHRIWRGLNTDEVSEPNYFAAASTVSAFTEGAGWLGQLREYIADNRRLSEKTIDEIPGIRAVPSHATYLMWLDCSELCEDSTKLADFLRSETGLILSDGSEFGGDGKSFLRMNIACPRERLRGGLERLRKGVEEFRKRM